MSIEAQKTEQADNLGTIVEPEKKQAPDAPRKRGRPRKIAVSPGVVEEKQAAPVLDVGEVVLDVEEFVGPKKELLPVRAGASSGGLRNDETEAVQASAASASRTGSNRDGKFWFLKRNR